VGEEANGRRLKKKLKRGKKKLKRGKRKAEPGKRKTEPAWRLTAVFSIGYDFFGRATRIVPSKRDTQQYLSNRGCFSRSNGVVERFVEPTKIFLGLNLYSTTRFRADYFFTHCLITSSHQMYFGFRVRSGCF
jgi:hypothetical protein